MPSTSYLNRNSATQFLLAAALGLLSVQPLLAQKAQEQQPLSPDKATNIRFWNMFPRDGKLLSLVSRRGENVDPIFNSLRGYDTISYVALEPKKYTFRVQDEAGKIYGDEIKIDAEKQCYYTIIAEPAKSGPRLRLIDDTYAFAAGAPMRFAVHQFIPGLTASVSVGNQPEKKISQGESAVFENLPSGSELRIQTTTPQGQKYDAKFPVSLPNGNHLSCVMVLDRYAEIMTRLQPDGYVEEAIDPSLLLAPPTPTPSATNQPANPPNP